MPCQGEAGREPHHPALPRVAPPPAPPVAVCPSATDRRDSARHDSRLIHAEPLDGAQPLHLDPRLEAVGIEAALLIGGRVVRLVGCWGWGWGWGYGWA